MPSNRLHLYGWYPANEIDKVDPNGGSTSVQSRVFNAGTGQVDVTYVPAEDLATYKTRAINTINSTCKTRITTSTFNFPRGSANNFSLSETAQRNWIWMRQEIQAGNDITPIDVTTVDEKVITVNNVNTILSGTMAAFAVVKNHRQAKATAVAAINDAADKDAVKTVLDAYLSS